MGLSGEERFSKIIWSVKNIEELLGGLKDYGADEIKTFQGKLWPALLNKESNDGFWLFGGGFDYNSFGGGGFLCEALSVHKPHKEDPFLNNSKKNYIDDNLDISRILGGNSTTEGCITSIYQWVESFYYAANRYEDGFSNSIVELKNVISNLKGKLFSEISDNPDYFRGYLLFNILQKCIDQYDDDCPLTKMIQDHCLFHNFSLREDHKTEDLFEAWREIQFTSTRDIPLQKKIFLTLCCFGRKTGEEYHARMIRKSLDGVVNETLLKEVLTYCAEQKREYDEKLSSSVKNRMDFCFLTSDY